MKLIENFYKCPRFEYPEVNLVEYSNLNEIQIHQGSTMSDHPSLEGKINRDVISMSMECAVEIAKQILEIAGE